MTIVPFGKYRDRPVEDMLADTDYMAWLEAQPWFRDRFAYLLPQDMRDNIDATPEHNRLQALFLDHSYCSAFVRRVDPTWPHGRQSWVEEKRTACHDHINELREGSGKYYPEELTALESKLANMAFPLDLSVTFEDRGADVVISRLWSWPGIWSHLDWTDNGKHFSVRSEHSSDALRIEVKPTVADDYPAVLRQMQRHSTTYCFVGAYTGQGATEAQFVAMFKASGRIVVFKRDVDALAT